MEFCRSIWLPAGTKRLFLQKYGRRYRTGDFDMSNGILYTTSRLLYDGLLFFRKKKYSKKDLMHFQCPACFMRYSPGVIPAYLRKVLEK